MASLAPLMQEIAAIFSSKTKQRLDALKTQNLKSKIYKNSIWIHCSSLGEYEMAKPLIRSFKNQNLLISFFSPSGYNQCLETETLKKLYLPLDSEKAAKEAFENLEPKAFILIKYEFWLNFMTESINQKVPIYLVSGLFRKNHFLSKTYAKPWRNVLGRFNRLYLQNHGSMDLAKEWGFGNTTFSGDLRFNQVAFTKNPRRG